MKPTIKLGPFTLSGKDGKIELGEFGVYGESSELTIVTYGNGVLLLAVRRREIIA